MRRKARGRIIQRRPNQRRPGQKRPLAAAAALRLRVISAAKAGALSRENALHALNLLLFDVLQFSARASGSATPEQSSLPPLLRRGGGAAALLPLCVLYEALSRKLGVPLELVVFDPPPTLVAEPPPRFLLRLPAQEGEFEIYVDVLNGGRLRSTHDLGDYLYSDGLEVELDEENAQLRQYVRTLDASDFCLELMRELEASCVSSAMDAEASFWKAQRDVLREELRQVEAE